MALVLSVAQAKLDWNLESTFLQHLQQQANETLASAEDASLVAHIYPTWVSESTCSTKCVDIRVEEEFCVATSACEHATWRKAFDRHSSQEEALNTFEVPMSSTHCEVWGDQNRCDGTLCDVDSECQSSCCGSFVSFTHNRCLPLIGSYCAGRDVTRKHKFKHGHENALDEHLTKGLQGPDDKDVEESSLREAIAEHIKGSTTDAEL